MCLLYFLKAWLTEIHEYAQKDVVIMLLGNKVSEASSSFFFFFALHKKDQEDKWSRSTILRHPYHTQTGARA